VWWTEVASFLGSIPGTAEEAEQAVATVRQLQSYLAGRLAVARQNPGADLMSLLASVGTSDCSLDELLANCILLLSAGQESTTNLIANGALALLRNPAQRQLLEENPAVAPHAVEELLRYDSPVQFTGRRILQDLELGGRHMRAGDFAGLVLGAANRDPEQFRDPDSLDIARPECRHLAFGAGAHFCLGAPLARLIAQVAMPALARRLPHWQLGPEPLEWKPNPALRALTALPLAAVQPALV
jgi:hypothetical protein